MTNTIYQWEIAICPCSSTPREVMEAVCYGSVVAHTIDVKRAKFIEKLKPQLTRTRLQATAIKRIVKLGKKATTLYACGRASKHQFWRGRHRIVWNLIIHTPITPFVEEKHYKSSSCVEECLESTPGASDESGSLCKLCNSKTEN